MKISTGTSAANAALQAFNKYLKENRQRSTTMAAAVMVGVAGLVALQFSGAGGFANALGNEDGQGFVFFGSKIFLDDSEQEESEATEPTVATEATAKLATVARSGFVGRNGKDLTLDGKEFKFVGYNNFALTGCAHGAMSAADMDKYFASLRPTSVTRTWAFKPLGLDGVKNAVASAERNNQKLILALGDGAQYCNDTGYNAGFYQSGYKGAYLNWVNQVVAAVKDSPAVMAYETMNEPCHTGAGGVTKEIMRNFFDGTAAAIKANDKNHLVFTGSLAEYDCGGALSDFAYVHGGANIDGGSLHEYDYLSVGQKGVSSHWNAVRPALHGIDKVAYVGEVGVGPEGSCLADAEMASAHKAKLDGYMNAGASGVLVWGFDDSANKACGLYSGRQITYGSATAAMFKNFTIQ